MAGRPGFFGGARQTETADREPDLMVGPGGLVSAVPVIRLGDPNGQRLNFAKSPWNGWLGGSNCPEPSARSGRG